MMTQDTLGEGEFGKVVLASLNNLRGKPGILYFVFAFFVSVFVFMFVLVFCILLLASLNNFRGKWFLRYFVFAESSFCVCNCFPNCKMQNTCRHSAPVKSIINSKLRGCSSAAIVFCPATISIVCRTFVHFNYVFSKHIWKLYCSHTVHMCLHYKQDTCGIWCIMYIS